MVRLVNTVSFTSVRTPPVTLFLSWTKSSNLFLAYEQQPDTVFLFLYRQLVTCNQGPKMGVCHGNQAVTWQLSTRCLEESGNQALAKSLEELFRTGKWVNVSGNSFVSKNK